MQALYFLLKLSTKRLDAFSKNEKKKPRGCLLVSIFLVKIGCSYAAGHTLSISLFLHNPRSTRLFSYRLRTGDEGISDDLTRMMGTAAITLLAMAMMTAKTTAIGARATTGGRLAYLCCAWQYSALSS